MHTTSSLLPEDSIENPNESANNLTNTAPELELYDTSPKNETLENQQGLGLSEAASAYTIDGHQFEDVQGESIPLPLGSLQPLPLSVADPMAPNEEIDILSVQQQQNTSDFGLLNGTNGVVGLNADIDLTNSNNRIEAGLTVSNGLAEFGQQAQHLPVEERASLAQVLPPPREAQGRKSRKNFEYRLQEVITFQQKHGHCMIPHKCKENPSLGTWIDTQRRRYRKTMDSTTAKKSGGLFISQDHIDRLEEVGFVFEPRLSRRDTWDKRVQEIKKYKTKHGHCNVREDDTSNPGLGKWISYVRRTYRLSKKKNSEEGNKKLSTARIKQLQDIGFVFELKEEMAMKRFSDGLLGLKCFLKKSGHLLVPKFYSENPTFGLCVEEMRIEYRKIFKGMKEGGDAFSAVMTAEVVKELSELGFLAEEGLTLQAHTTISESEAVENEVALNNL